jgi:hypothetical protein
MVRVAQVERGSYAGGGGKGGAMRPGTVGGGVGVRPMPPGIAGGDAMCCAAALK